MHTCDSVYVTVSEYTRECGVCVCVGAGVSVSVSVSLSLCLAGWLSVFLSVCRSVGLSVVQQPVNRHSKNRMARLLSQLLRQKPSLQLWAGA